VVFHTLNMTAPGLVIRQYVLLTSQNRRRLVGTWSRMPSVSDLPFFTTFEVSYNWTSQTLPEYLYHDKMMVWEVRDQLHYCVSWSPMYMYYLYPPSDSTDHVSFPSECWGVWVRVPDEVGLIFENQVSVSHAHITEYASTLG
jgi:hypothetical protein